MNMLESARQSFIIRVWLEETAEEAHQAKWRGHITHVPSGQRHYLETLAEISPFIAPYLQAMGVRSEETTLQDHQECAGQLNPVSRVV